MERMRTAGVELEYEVWGGGQPAIFIHGAFIADTFRPLLVQRCLAERYGLILYHRRGYTGSSRCAGPISVAQQAEDCSVLLRHIGVERARVVGHSYGGAVALQLALDAPELVHSVAVLEPALMAGSSAEGYRESLLRSVERFRADDAAALVDEFLRARWPGYRAELDRALPGALDQAVADAGTAFESELPGLLDWRFGETEARRISQPVLSVLGGESNALWPRFGETHQLLLTWLPRAEGFILPGATHMMHVADPTSMAEALAAFWSRHPA